MSSILSTSACGVGTQTTSLPAWPTFGSNGAWVVAVCASAAAATSHNPIASAPHPLTRAVIQPPQTSDVGRRTSDVGRATCYVLRAHVLRPTCHVRRATRATVSLRTDPERV